MKTDSKNLALVSRLLTEISNETLCLIRTKGLDNVLEHSTKHIFRGFYERVSLKKELFERWRLELDLLNINLDTLAAEVITFHNGDPLEPHIHHSAYAVLTFLGEWEGVKEPQGAFYWHGSKDVLLPVVFSKTTLQVTPGTIHGFICVDEGRDLSFLSIQSKIINDDYHLVNPRQ